MTRQEHITYCKQRALEYVDRGSHSEAFSSMASDLMKHPDTANHPGLELGMCLIMMGKLNTDEEMSTYIAGFN